MLQKGLYDLARVLLESAPLLATAALGDWGQALYEIYVGVPRGSPTWTTFRELHNDLDVWTSMASDVRDAVYGRGARV